MDWTEGSDDMLAERERLRREEAEQEWHDRHGYDPTDDRCPLCVEEREARAEEDGDQDPADQASYWREGWDEHDDRL